MEAVRSDGSPMKVGSVGAALTATTGRGKTFLTESTEVRTHVSPLSTVRNNLTLYTL